MKIEDAIERVLQHDIEINGRNTAFAMDGDQGGRLNGGKLSESEVESMEPWKRGASLPFEMLWKFLKTNSIACRSGYKKLFVIFAQNNELFIMILQNSSYVSIDPV